MPSSRINGVNLYWEMTGSTGEPLVLVHGSWVDHRTWDRVVPELARSFRVVRYDRRGHSRSESVPGQGSRGEDVADLLALIDQLRLAPANVAGGSFGAAITLTAAGEQPDAIRRLFAHEPPVFGLLADDPAAATALAAVRERVEAVAGLLAAGKLEAGAERFVETIAFGPGAWPELPPELRRTFVTNAPTFLDELQEPASQVLDLEALRRYHGPAVLSHGDASPPFFLAVMDKVASALPQAVPQRFAGAGHVPHLSHPADYVRALRRYLAPELSA